MEASQEASAVPGAVASRWLRDAKEILLALESDWSNSQRDKLRAEESCRRLEEQLAEKQRSLDFEITQRYEQIQALTQRVNFLVFPPDPMDDDNVSGTKKRLDCSLDIWVKSNFRDSSRLESITVTLLSTRAAFLKDIEEP
ncbi:hypothetical protein BBP40_010969 [Aspergillus hancockii]|nr:hypothetical protein BBP40_010969 [Aspergillus hancockii]